MLSVIIPAYNEEKMIPKTTQRISEILTAAAIPYELIFVDDGSRDRTWAEICSAVDSGYSVRGYKFSRNFGKEAAMFCGLEYAAGDCCVIIDCDLQHPPEKIVEMYRLWEEGYEVVEGVKEDRGSESAMHALAAKSFYSLISKAVNMDMSSASDFKLLDRKVVNALNAMKERSIFFRAMSYWLGYRKAEVRYCVNSRTEGTSKWSTKSLIRYALTNITSFSSFPLHSITILGWLMFFVSVVFSAIAVYQKFSGIAEAGFTTVILLILLTGSLTMISLGIIAYYIGKIYEEVKGRPRFVVSEHCGSTK